MAIDSIAAGLDSVRAKLAGTIRQAAAATGASFEYLVSAAKIESNLNPSAAASTSSARGLYQFIEQTWLGTVKEAGAAFGYGQYANAISKSASGHYYVDDPAARANILKLRDDPAANAAMAGVLTQSNSFKLTGELGRRPTDGELYIAHFMGANGAARLITGAQSNPNASALAFFPAAAAANRPIFYNRDGSPRSVSQVYSVLTSRYAQAANSPVTRTAMASTGVTSGSASDPISLKAPNTETYLAYFPQATQAATDRAAALQGQQDQMFRSLFQAGSRTEPVSPAVQSLWSNMHTSAATTTSSTATGQAPFNLFSDPTGAYSG
ncbi:lytic transglycosylase domain-containing protein [Afipia sp. TerB]